MRGGRIILLLGLLALMPALSACENMDVEDMFSTKKKLPGERKDMFPEGVPGVAQGVPPEYMQGYQRPPDMAQTPSPEEKAAADKAASLQGLEPDDKPKPKKKPKPKPKTVSAPTQVTVAPARGQQQQQPQQGQAPWPDQQQGQQPPQQQQSSSPWPASR